MNSFVDFDEYTDTARDAFRNPGSFIERTRHNGTLDDTRVENEMYELNEVPESYLYQAAMMPSGPRARRRYGNVHLEHKGKRHYVSGAMIHSMVPSFKAAAMGVDPKSGEILEKYPIVSEDRSIHTTPMWPVSASQSKEMRISAPLENGEMFEQNVKNSDLHVGAVMEHPDNGSTFLSIHGVGALINQSLQAAREAGAAVGVFSYKAPVSNKELTVATKMSPTLDNIRDGCHKMSVGTEMVAPINKKLELPVHTVLEEKPATYFASTYKAGNEVKTTESTPVSNAVAHIQNMKVSAAIKDEMTSAIAGAYASKRFVPGTPAMKVEAFYGKGLAYHQTGAVHLPSAEVNAAHTYTDEPVSTSFVGVKMGDESVVCHVTEGVENAGMTTIRTCMSPNSETPYTKVTNMHGKVSNAFRVSAPIKEGERASGKSLTFVHSN